MYSACLHFPVQEKRYSEACGHFNTVLQVTGYNADTCYCIALCHYMMKQYAAALKYITEIIERGIKEHPGIVYCQQSLHTVPSYAVISAISHFELYNVLSQPVLIYRGTC